VAQLPQNHSIVRCANVAFFQVRPRLGELRSRRGYRRFRVGAVFLARFRID
jgi:hypothetical protein